jgi:TadE-like protein
VSLGLAKLERTETPKGSVRSLRDQKQLCFVGQEAQSNSRFVLKARKRERGASIVEFALVLPLFIGLLMGFIDFGLNLNNISGVRQAVREGVRDVAVGDPGDAVCTLIAPPSPAPAEKTKALLCGIRKSVPGSSVRLRLSYPDDHISGQKAVVCAQYQVASATGFYQSLLTKTVTKVQTQMRIERVEPDLDEYSESAFAGQNWTWCP